MFGNEYLLFKDPESDDEIELHFIIQDSGIGISEDKQPQLFKPFVQGSGAQYGGTGLGLAICRQLVTMMKGRIWVESQPNCGSTFHFTVKLNKCVNRLLAAVDHPGMKELKGNQIVIVDDNINIRIIVFHEFFNS